MAGSVGGGGEGGEKEEGGRETPSLQCPAPGSCECTFPDHVVHAPPARSQTGFSRSAEYPLTHAALGHSH